MLSYWEESSIVENGVLGIFDTSDLGIDELSCTAPNLPVTSGAAFLSSPPACGPRQLVMQPGNSRQVQSRSASAQRASRPQQHLETMSNGGELVLGLPNGVHHQRVRGGKTSPPLRSRGVATHHACATTPPPPGFKSGVHHAVTGGYATVGPWGARQLQPQHRTVVRPASVAHTRGASPNARAVVRRTHAITTRVLQKPSATSTTSGASTLTSGPSPSPNSTSAATAGSTLRTATGAGCPRSMTTNRRASDPPAPEAFLRQKLDNNTTGTVAAPATNAGPGTAPSTTTMVCKAKATGAGAVPPAGVPLPLHHQLQNVPTPMRLAATGARAAQWAMGAQTTTMTTTTTTTTRCVPTTTTTLGRVPSQRRLSLPSAAAAAVPGPMYITTRT